MGYQGDGWGAIIYDKFNGQDWWEGQQLDSYESETGGESGKPHTHTFSANYIPSSYTVLYLKKIK